MKLYNLDDDLKRGLKRARKEAKPKRTQGELAEALKERYNDKVPCSDKTIKNWEQGQNKPTLETLLMLCDFYQCDLDYLVGRIDEKTHDLQFICDYTGLSAESIKLLHEWKNCEDRRKFRLDYINGITAHEEFESLMEKVDELTTQTHLRGLAVVEDDYEDKRESVNMIDACLFRISQILTTILDSVNTQMTVRSLDRRIQKKMKREGK